MDSFRRPGPHGPDPSPPVLDMTPDGQFRDAAPRGAGWLDRALGRVGGVALLVALAAGGLLAVALAIAFVSLLLPTVIGAGAIAAASIWWRLRRLRRQGGAGGAPGAPGAVRFVFVRR